jgi:predicted deacylase
MKIIENYKNIPFAYLIDSEKPGKSIMLIGATHGNEPSGYLSNLQLLENIKNGSLILKEGKIILVTKANYKAFEKNQRCIDIDLNRVISKDFI